MSSKISTESEEQQLQETLEDLLGRFKIQNWDLLLVGDGSGSNWNFECGWGCVSIEQATLKRRTWYGAMNAGTVNFAEIMAYFQPLCWYVDREMRLRQSGSPVQMRNVHIITDSQYVRRKGEENNPLAGKNGALWQVFRQFASQGMNIHWHWLRREIAELNQFSDQLSKAARLNLKGKDLPTRVEEKNSRTLYEFNPCE